MKTVLDKIIEELKNKGEDGLAHHIMVKYSSLERKQIEDAWSAGWNNSHEAETYYTECDSPKKYFKNTYRSK